jgi:hypothetical protein
MLTDESKEMTGIDETLVNTSDVDLTEALKRVQHFDVQVQIHGQNVLSFVFSSIGFFTNNGYILILASVSH